MDPTRPTAGRVVYNLATHSSCRRPAGGPNPADGEVTEIDPVTFLVTNHFALTASDASREPGARPIAESVGGLRNREGERSREHVRHEREHRRDHQVHLRGGEGRPGLVQPRRQSLLPGGADMENGSVLGIIDASNNMWLYNSPTGGNAHGLAADPPTTTSTFPFRRTRDAAASARRIIAVYAAHRGDGAGWRCETRNPLDR